MKKGSPWTNSKVVYRKFQKYNLNMSENDKLGNQEQINYLFSIKCLFFLIKH